MAIFQSLREKKKALASSKSYLIFEKHVFFFVVGVLKLFSYSIRDLKAQFHIRPTMRSDFGEKSCVRDVCLKESPCSYEYIEEAGNKSRLM